MGEGSGTGRPAASPSLTWPGRAGADTSQACRTTSMEGAEINTSLLALKGVILALATGSSLKRNPFRKESL